MFNEQIIEPKNKQINKLVNYSDTSVVGVTRKKELKKTKTNF